MSDAPEPELGIAVGRYRLIRRLGQGGMGVVYLAEQEALGKRVVVKLLRPELSADREQVERFFNEARAAAHLAHPGIVDVLDVGTDGPDGPAYFVMEALDGESLGARLRRDRTLSVELAVAILRQAALAVAAAHGSGIVHRDLKPDNLFLVPDREIAIGVRVKVLDFGLAKLLDEALAAGVRTRTGELMGTPLYMAPEQCRGAGGVDHRADVYALGCIAYEMVCGRPPFVARGLGEVLLAHQTEAPAPPSTRAAIPPALEDVIVRALAKKPWERQQSCQQLADELAALQVTASTRRAPAARPAVDASAVTVATLDPRGPAPPASPSRRAWWIAGGAAIAIAAFAIAIVASSGGDSPARGPAPARPPRDAADAIAALDVDTALAACEQGEATRCRDLGIYLHRRGRNPEAIAAHHRGCELGAWRSCALLATLLRRGAGTIADAPRAAVLDRTACDHDDAAGCLGLGQALLAGNGVALDPVAGRAALARACELSPALGCAALADATARGLGGPPDPGAARALYQRACGAGDADACRATAAP
jgi:TPR repeat protein/tRNA A-37 threonylcarbamoyl transferase component Bud32